MKAFVMALSLTLPVVSNCYASCTCDDWMSRGGYCVDYVPNRVPAFPIPRSHAEITELKNQDIKEISEGDVAIFDLGNYWHVSYVEKVNRDDRGNPVSIDVSEMNNGGSMSFDEFRSKWSPKKRSEWKRAICCGVTDEYDQVSFRRNVPLTTITQVWSPTAKPAAMEGSVAAKARDTLTRLFKFIERELL